jgi:hypothetical protein
MFLGLQQEAWIYKDSDIRILPTTIVQAQNRSNFDIMSVRNAFSNQ